ncbi:hypothetical protein GCM10011348_16030 [Marinobacterium nitratireducens]|uniref:Type II secretion system protein GspB C-terminal domain-containing protein n=1 Tax=Marinobacterium nitratireducens TaxID=518897 RepID=A0A918DQI9_9GAMM|nr:general secretion pathway protein GspB [Marinobacterium nitratireducens]GGO80097.1 hypothetical protein GCM10011348_16030 [Marinobacterium nitratireducens]
MSYILDALKQSESKRKAEPPPNPEGAAVIARPRRQTRPGGRMKWLLPLLAIMAVLVWWQRTMQPGPETGVVVPVEKAATVAPAESQPSAAAPTPRDVAAIAPDAASADDLRGVRIQVQEPVPAPATTAVVRTPPSRPSERPAPAQQQPAAAETDTAVAETPAAPASPYDDVPYWRQLPVEVQRSLPELKFSVHIYSDDPASRRVKVGERMLREGQIITQDVRLVAIIPRGVILSKQEYRFRMNAL